jgi:hypothetical protein
MGFCCLRPRTKLAWESGRNNKRMPANAGMSFLYFQVGDQRNSERLRRSLSPGTPLQIQLFLVENTIENNFEVQMAKA